uniref:Uncharacterized protein n=1 Tax=Psilocybe cubensis TaxID=181762 RepID=A0A8H8CJ73_PSICU
MSGPDETRRVSSQATIGLPQAAAQFQRGSNHSTTAQPMLSHQERESRTEIFTFDLEEIPETGILPPARAHGRDPAQNQRKSNESQDRVSRKRNQGDEPLQSGSGSSIADSHGKLEVSNYDTVSSPIKVTANSAEETMSTCK